MTWFKVDDGFAFHPKAVAAGNAALGLWVRAGSWSGQQLTDGHVPETMLAPLGGVSEDALALVAAGLWHAPGDDCEVCKEQSTVPFAVGYQFHDWMRMQPTRADKEAERLAARERKRKQRERQGRDEETGRFGVTQKSRRDKGVTSKVSRRDTPVSHTDPVPSRPDPKERVANLVSQLTVVRADGKEFGIDSTAVARIKDLTGGDDKHVTRSAKYVLDKAPGRVDNPGSYIIAAINDDPAAFKYHRRAPRRDEQCTEHAGEWADSCRGCAIDARLGD